MVKIVNGLGTASRVRERLLSGFGERERERERNEIKKKIQKSSKQYKYT